MFINILKVNCKHVETLVNEIFNLSLLRGMDIDRLPNHVK